MTKEPRTKASSFEKPKGAEPSQKPPKLQDTSGPSNSLKACYISAISQTHFTFPPKLFLHTHTVCQLAPLTLAISEVQIVQFHIQPTHYCQGVASTFLEGSTSCEARGFHPQVSCSPDVRVTPHSNQCYILHTILMSQWKVISHKLFGLTTAGHFIKGSSVTLVLTAFRGLPTGDAACMILISVSVLHKS